MEEQKPMRPSSNLALAICTTILCCLPLGIVAIIKSTKVDKYYDSGDYTSARQASEDAKKLSFWGIGISVAVWIIYLVVVVGIMGSALAFADFL